MLLKLENLCQIHEDLLHLDATLLVSYSYSIHANVVRHREKPTIVVLLKDYLTHYDERVLVSSSISLHFNNC